MASTLVLALYSSFCRTFKYGVVYTLKKTRGINHYHEFLARRVLPRVTHALYHFPIEAEAPRAEVYSVLCNTIETWDFFFFLFSCYFVCSTLIVSCLPLKPARLTILPFCASRLQKRVAT